MYKSNEYIRVEGFKIADWAGLPSDKRSKTSFCTFFDGNLISRKSKRQFVVARSSAKAKDRAMAHATSELSWLQHFLQEINLSPPTPILMLCDNKTALHIASNPIFHERTKYIKIDCHFVLDKIMSSDIGTQFVKTGDQLADMFTKSLNGNRLRFLSFKLGYMIYMLQLEVEC